MKEAESRKKSQGQNECFIEIQKWFFIFIFWNLKLKIFSNSTGQSNRGTRLCPKSTANVQAKPDGIRYCRFALEGSNDDFSSESQNLWKPLIWIWEYSLSSEDRNLAGKCSETISRVLWVHNNMFTNVLKLRGTKNPQKCWSSNNFIRDSSNNFIRILASNS